MAHFLQNLEMDKVELSNINFDMYELRKKADSQVKNPYDPSHTIYYGYFEDITIADKQAINAQTWLTQANQR